MKRTSLLHGVTFLFFVLLLGGVPILSIPQQASAQSNPIVLENQNPGTNNWRINYNTGTFSDDVVQQIKGYASATSVNHGGSINLHVTVNPAQTYTIDVYRMGWYGGAGGRLMQSIANLNGITQPACPILAATGTVECNWSVSHTLAVPANWTTGIYLAKLTNARGFQSYIVFAVRDDNRVADFLYQQPVNTYQAYNNFPADNTTGKSLYDFNSFGPLTAAGTPRANKVSFNRPYGGSAGPDGGGQFADNQWWERYFISWAERMGYDISYTTDVDTHANPGRLLNFKGVIVAGHSEYWTKQMYDAVQNARDQGVSLAFLGANPVYFQVRLESSSTGSANRTLVGYKSLTLDPIADPTLRTGYWRDLNRAEQQLVGVQFTADGDFFATQPYIIKNSSHWVWANSGFVDGSVVPNLTGYEVDRLHAEYPAPNSLSYTTLAESPYAVTTADPPRNDTSQSSIYQAPSGAWVFASGTMSWVWALDRPGFVNAGIQQAAKNILDRFLAGAVSSTPTPVAATATPVIPTSTPTNTPVVPPNTPTNTPVVPTNTPISPTNTPLPTATPLSGTIDRRISQSDDDSEQSYNTGATLLTSADIELGYDLGATSVYQLCGLRFQNITVPRGATITSAYIEFATGTTDANGRGSLGIHGQASDNAPAFTTTNYNLSNRPFTNAVVAWNNIPNWNVLGARNLTPSLRTIVQEIVNRNGWNSGNSLAFLIEGTGRHAAYAYDGRPSSAARLVIKWTSARMTVPEEPSDSQGNLGNPAQTASLSLEFDGAAPGSTLRLVGQAFPANSTLTLLNSGVPFATVQSDANGSFHYLVHATEEGTFSYSVAGNATVSAALRVAADLPLRIADEGEYPESAEGGSGRIYLPIISSGQR